MALSRGRRGGRAAPSRGGRRRADEGGRAAEAEGGGKGRNLGRRPGPVESGDITPPAGAGPLAAWEFPISSHHGQTRGQRP